MAIHFKLRLPQKRRQGYRGLPLSNSTSPPTPSSPTFFRKRTIRRTRLVLLTLGFVISYLFVFGTQHLGTKGRIRSYYSHADDALSTSSGYRGDGGEIKFWSERINEWVGKCRGWDPEKSEDQDPINCLKAKQYRQTMRVLEREEEAKQYVFSSPFLSQISSRSRKHPDI